VKRSTKSYSDATLALALKEVEKKTIYEADNNTIFYMKVL